MNILLSSASFDPNYGGVETVSAILATEFVRLGHEVKVVTQTAAPSERSFPFEVIRRPRPLRLLMLVRWADIYFQNHISLWLAWPLVVLSRPWVVTQHTWLPKSGMNGLLRAHLKRFALRFATTVAISQPMATDLPAPVGVIGDPYDSANFRTLPSARHESDVVFVGRLVPDKGAHLIVEAIALLKQRSRLYNVTVVGSGPEEQPLRQMVRDLDLGHQVHFAGKQMGAQLARTLNSHKVLVVPSLWQEPFGIVALEGCACGCVVIGSDVGGLREAIGPCGVTFPAGDVRALAGRIDELCSTPARLESYRAAGREHLARHTPKVIARQYLAVFEVAIKTRNGG
jgi:glycosyltransferase involved in cell wall biosynthesis